MTVNEIAPGMTVTLHYVLTLEDGLEVDNSRGGEPLVFTLGDGTLIAGLEDCLIGMCAGEAQRYTVEPTRGFGFPDPQNIHELPRDDFPLELDLTPGVVLSFAAPDGEEIPGVVLELDEARVKVDFNHPLAGHTLIFEVEIIDVRPAQS